jgi:hypothetical protein
VPVNCFTFDALSRLSDNDMNLFFVTGRCFVCHFATHHTEVCPHHGHHLLFCKRLLGKPHCVFGPIDLVVVLSDSLLQSGTLVVPVLMRRWRRKLNGKLERLRGTKR